MNCTVLENREAGRGNRWLKLKLLEGPIDHEPGTVLGLTFQKDGASYRHAYTVSRADEGQRTLEFLYRVIPEGRMTPVLAGLEAGAEIRIAGRGGHPISGEVNTDPEGIVLVSTGTGVGPIWGFSEHVLAQGYDKPLKLFAGFREEADACLQDELKALAAKHPNFEWQFSLSKPGPAWQGLKGRVSESMPALLGPVRNVHFHLVGNGAMVLELYRALRSVGLADERLTSEIYFNYPNHVDPQRVEAIASRFTY